MIKHTDTLIIGGGISGLSTAWWLSQRGIQPVLLESAPRAGGLIDSTQKDGYLTDHAASMLLNFNVSVNQFINASGLLSRKIMRNEIDKRFLCKQGELVEVPNNIHGLMFSDLFSMKARMRLVSEIFRPGRPAGWESVADFIKRRLGQELLDLAIDPYVSAVLACDPEKACARATLPRLSKLEQQFGSFTAGILLKKLLPGKKGLPQEAFSFEGGMKTLVETLSQKMASNIELGQQVQALEPLKRGWRVIANNGEFESQFIARHIVFSTPANIAASLLKPSQPELAELLSKVEYAPIAQIHLGFDQAAFTKKPKGSGFLVPGRESSIPVRGSLWMSNLIKNRAPQNKLLTSNFIGGACQAGALDQPDNVLIDQSLLALSRLCGLKGTPEMIRVNRHQQGLPLYHGQYDLLTQAIDSRAKALNGLHFVANYLQGISIRDRIIQANKVASQIGLSLCESPKISQNYSPDIVTGLH